MKKLILSFIIVLVFAIDVAMAATETAPTPCPEQQAVKIVRGPAGPAGPRGTRGPVGPQGMQGLQGEVSWWLLVLSGVVGGLFGGVIVLALNQPAHPAPAQPQPIQPVNIFNNVLPPGVGQGGQQPQPPHPPQQ